jgi:hypothetical protein
MKSNTLYKVALYALISLFCVGILLHILVLAKFIPYKYVGGGRIQSLDDMYKIESGALVINALFLVVSLLRAGLIQNKIPSGAFQGLFGFMAFLFAVNTVGNLFAVTAFEIWIFTPFTLILSLASLIVAQKRIV